MYLLGEFQCRLCFVFFEVFLVRKLQGPGLSTAPDMHNMLSVFWSSSERAGAWLMELSDLFQREMFLFSHIISRWMLQSG